MSLSPSRRVLLLLAAVPLAIFTLSKYHAPQPQPQTFSSAVDSTPGQMFVASPMRVARAAHSATVLNDARVLIAGGFTGDESAEHGAELYEPTAERFTRLPRMVTVRHSHTATKLANGKVLLVGGYTSGNTVVRSAELFNPLDNTFAPTGALDGARAGHVAVLLRSGKVLVMGGVGPGWSFLSSAELYDPLTGTFSTTGAMSVARESHVAVRLGDGRVLVIGGHRDRRAAITLYASSELYDEASGSFRSAGAMTIRRHKHDAVLLADGRVLVTGGADERDSEGVYNSTELFDPRTLTFKAGPPMQRGRYKHQGSSMLLSDGRVLIAGGAEQAETFDPVSESFALVPGSARLAGQFSAAALLAGGGALITGGYGSGGGPRSSTWLYRP